jgi:HPt (histidine-containing phosphotransfer) domain-containing protein
VPDGGGTALVAGGTALDTVDAALDAGGTALDAETVDELRDLGEEAFAHLYGTYAGALADTVAALVTAAGGGAWSEDDERSVPRLAHRLKGSSAAMGALRMAELCEELQHGTGATPDLDRALSELREESMRVREAVTSLLAGH